MPAREASSAGARRLPEVARRITADHSSPRPRLARITNACPGAGAVGRSRLERGRCVSSLRLPGSSRLLAASLAALPEEPGRPPPPHRQGLPAARPCPVAGIVAPGMVDRPRPRRGRSSPASLIRGLEIAPGVTAWPTSPLAPASLAPFACRRRSGPPASVYAEDIVEAYIRPAPRGRAGEARTSASGPDDPKLPARTIDWRRPVHKHMRSRTPRAVVEFGWALKPGGWLASST